MTAPPLVFLVGPTGAGKTAAALALADRLPLEILSVDSAQVYRGLDIGTAKPDAAERARVPHRLIDLVDPAEAYSAARFAEDAAACVDDARARGRLPLLAGGTMLYARALVGGLDALPAADPELRARIEDEARVLGWPAMHARLAALDPATAARLAPADAQRVQRALEVVLLTGTPLSALHGRATTPARPAVFVSLEPADRGWLHERLAQRFDAMLDAGLLDEVRALRARGDLHPGLPSIRSVGYRQAWAHLDGDGDLATLRARATAATRQLAKRQLTWLRAMPGRIVVPCDAPDAAARAADAIRAAFGA